MQRSKAIVYLSLILVALLWIPAAHAELPVNPNEQDFTGTEEFDMARLPVLAYYLQIYETLCADDIAEVGRTAGLISLRAKKIDPTTIQNENAPMYRNIPKDLRRAGRAMFKAKTLEELRAGFRDLSRPVVIWAGLSKPTGLAIFYCPVSNATWVQPEGDVKNPYHGSKMHGCGQAVANVPQPEPEPPPATDASPQ